MLLISELELLHLALSSHELDAVWTYLGSQNRSSGLMARAFAVSFVMALTQTHHDWPVIVFPNTPDVQDNRQLLRVADRGIKSSSPSYTMGLPGHKACSRFLMGSVESSRSITTISGLMSPVLS